MLSKEEIEKARSNILRGNDIESACLIIEAVIWDGLVQVGGRVNIAKVAMRQILNFIEEYKNKGYLDVVREKVQANEKIKQLETENKELTKNNFNLNIESENKRKEYQETYKDVREEIKELKADKQRIIELNNKYLQKLVYLLSPTTHALGDDYNSKFKQIIKENIDLETCKIKQKLKECWGIDKF